MCYKDPKEAIEFLFYSLYDTKNDIRNDDIYDAIACLLDEHKSFEVLEDMKENFHHSDLVVIHKTKANKLVEAHMNVARFKIQSDIETNLDI